MEYYDNNHQSEDYDNEYLQKDIKNLLLETKKMDRGFNTIYRYKNKADGSLKRTKIEIYTSSGIGKHIRDAETGEYFQHKVGSLDEDLYFKVSLATGECKSKNNSSTLFYLSPRHYISHIGINNLNEKIVNDWEVKMEKRINSIKKEKEKKNILTEKIIH